MMVLILIWSFPEEAQNARQAEEEREQAKSEMHSWDLPTAGLHYRYFLVLVIIIFFVVKNLKSHTLTF